MGVWDDITRDAKQQGLTLLIIIVVGVVIIVMIIRR
jgi:hypothetical protein